MIGFRLTPDPLSSPIFLREQLPHDHGSFGRKFVANLDRITTGLTLAFLTAAHKLVGAGFGENIDAVAAGAIRDLDGYGTVLVEALDDLVAIQRSHHREGAERWRAIEDGECDTDYEEYYTSGHDDDGYASGIFIDTYITTMRAAGRWQDLARHPRVKDLAGHWAREISRSAVSATTDEVRVVLETTRASGDEEAGWDAARAHWAAALEPDLAQRILSNPSDERLRRSLAQCALAAAQSTLVDCFNVLAASAAVFVHLLADVHAAQGMIAAKMRARKVRPVLKALAPEAADIFRALAFKNRGRSLSEQRRLHCSNKPLSPLLRQCSPRSSR